MKQPSPTGPEQASLRTRVASLLRTTADATGLSPVLRSLRHLPARRLHPLRRSRLERRLRRMPLPSSVLFVCHGNIYRSPYAAHVFESGLPPALRQSIRVRSAGFVGPGRPSPDAALELAAARGHDMARHRSSLLDPQGVGGAGLIVVMDTHQQRAICQRFGRGAGDVIVLGDLDPAPIATRTIPDPWGRSGTVLADSYDRIERCAGALVTALLVGR